MPRITRVGGNLFQIAGQNLGDATQANRIARLNNHRRSVSDGR